VVGEYSWGWVRLKIGNVDSWACPENGLELVGGWHVGDRFKTVCTPGISADRTGTILELNCFGSGHRASIDGTGCGTFWVKENQIEHLDETPESSRVDITSQVTAKVRVLKSFGRALIELCDGEICIGLFDRKHGFIYMSGAEENYLVKDSFQSEQTMCWFKVYRLNSPAVDVDMEEFERGLLDDTEEVDEEPSRAVLVKTYKNESRKPFIIYGKPTGEIITLPEYQEELEADRDRLNQAWGKEFSYSIWYLNPGQTLKEFAEEHGFNIVGEDEEEEGGIDENTSRPRYIIVRSFSGEDTPCEIIWSDHYEDGQQTHAVPYDDKAGAEKTRDKMNHLYKQFDYRVELIGVGTTLEGYAKHNGYTIA